MFDDKEYEHYYDAFESLQYRSRMKTLDWSQWGFCPVCQVKEGEECLNKTPSYNHQRIKRFRMRPHWERHVVVYPMCGVCDSKGYLLEPLRKCRECGGIGQLQDQPSEEWWYKVWQETGENLWQLNNREDKKG